MITNLYKISEFSKLMPLVIEISRDKIIIVRIAVAIAISTILKNAPEMSDMFREAVNNLKQD